MMRLIKERIKKTDDGKGCNYQCGFLYCNAGEFYSKKTIYKCKLFGKKMKIKKYRYYITGKRLPECISLLKNI